MRYLYEHMEDLKDINFPDFLKYSGNLILYGAGINGALCAFSLKELGVNFLCFCDSDPLKQGTRFLGYPVLSPQDCYRSYPNAAILFDVYCSGNELSRLCSIGYETILFPASLFLGLDCTKAARYVTNEFGKDERGYTFREEIDELQIFEWIDEYMIRGVGYVNGKREMSRSINLDLTDFCTLRCKNCLALKPYFKDKRDLSWKEMSHVIDQLTSLKWFRRFHLLGGEPFLYPYLDKVLEKLCDVLEVEHVNVITNGTVVPNERIMQLLSNKKFMVRISYYGVASSNYLKLVDTCKQRGVEVRVHAQRWKDIGRALDTVSNDEETLTRFQECSQRAGAFFYVLHGKATLCPFAANTEALKLYDAKSRDFVDLNEDFSTKNLFQSLNNLYWGVQPLTACYYCNGWLPYATKPIPVAEQYALDEYPQLPRY